MSSDSSSSTSGPIDDSYEPAWGGVSDEEPRLPASIAIIVAMLIQAVLPHDLTRNLPLVILGLELLILIPISFSAPKRHKDESKLLRVLAIVVIALVSVANFATLILLIYALFFESGKVNSPELFFSGLGIWTTNVIAFALWFWEIDRGGPHERTHKGHEAPDFLFPQMSTPGSAPADWAPKFFDYLYIAFTNATAFSPTDVLPLSARAKLLMLLQSAVALATISLVAARAVNIIA
ncbi:MAG: hypothetical protein SFY67_02070 [Candidatus Melainabacteria bacterium]|nr:hypothetical protein [Candidatus Melainabacteria bacterium]